jgi:hypothetical protein
MTSAIAFSFLFAYSNNHFLLVLYSPGITDPSQQRGKFSQQDHTSRDRLGE